MRWLRESFATIPIAVTCVCLCCALLCFTLSGVLPVAFTRLSTLLDVIAGRKDVALGDVGGLLLFDGVPRSRFFHRTSAYVLQVKP